MDELWGISFIIIIVFSPVERALGSGELDGNNSIEFALQGERRLRLAFECWGEGEKGGENAFVNHNHRSEGGRRGPVDSRERPVWPIHSASDLGIVSCQRADLGGLATDRHFMVK